MSMKQTLIAALLATVPAVTFAAASIDVFYGYSEARDKSATSFIAKGDGYGLRASAELNDKLQLTGLYQNGTGKVDGAGVKIDVDEIRVGLMARHRVESLTLLGGIERVQYQGTARGTGISGSDRGFVAKLGAGGHVGKLALKVTGGYVNLDNRTDGHEIEVSLAAPLVERVSGFTDYRYTRLKDAENDSSTDNLVRVGLRYAF